MTHVHTYSIEPFSQLESYEFSCDDCSAASIDVEAYSFSEAVNELKNAKWLIKKDGNDWVHICDDCQK